MERRLFLAVCLVAACNRTGLPLPAMTDQAIASCRFDAPVDRTAVVFAATTGGQLVFVRGDGSHNVAHTSPRAARKSSATR